jgi:trans-aconitate methyltransferase
MELQHAIALIQNNRLVKGKAATWADLGCGTGLFTQALIHFLQPGSVVYAVDSSKNALSRIEPPSQGIVLEKVQADFVQDVLPFRDLDGLLMANALHFVRDKANFLKKAEKWLKADGCFLVVEYDTDRANPWVPYPVSFRVLNQLFTELGYQKVERVSERPSIYHRAPIYSALVNKK